MKKLTLLLMLLICAAALAQELPEFAGQEPSPPAPGQEPKPILVAEEFRSLLLRVNYEPNSTDLTPPSAAALDSMAAQFRQNRQNRYEVHGHTCPDAGAKKVMRFSAQRVEAMVDYLQANGVSAANIVTIINPAPDNAAAECTQDRRVDIMSVETRWVEKHQPEPVAIPEPVVAPEPVAALEPVVVPEPVAAPEIIPTPAQEGKSILAIYMAGEEPQTVRGVHSILGGELARTISESDKYLAVDRTSDILKQIEKEHVYQRTGAVSDDQIKDLGQQLGANYLCISNINPVGKKYYLDARLVDVVTAEITRTVTATSSLRDANEMARVARNMAFELIETEKARQQRLRRKKILLCTSLGLDILGAGTLAYGYLENENVVKEIKNNDGPEADRAATRRNTAYIVGGAFLATGVSIHIFF